MNSHHNTSHHSSHDPNESKPAVLDVSSTTVKPDKSHKFGIRVLPDMKAEDKMSNNIAPQPVVLTMENEKHLNNGNIYIEQNKTQQKSYNEKPDFDEIDLSDKSQAIDEPDGKTRRANTPSPTTNVKSIIAKGLQNLQKKLHQPHHKKQSSLDIAATKQVDAPDSCVIDMNPSSQHGEESIVPDDIDTVQTNAQHVMKSFLEKEKSHATELKSPSPISNISKNDSFSSTEGDGKRSKRKAPAPPVTTDVELHAEPTDTFSSKDSDSEMGNSSSTTIELNSTHITVHHIPDDTDRKAASLGDLSKFTSEEVPASVLERAMSLELADGTSNPRDSKKRKAPIPPPDEMVLDEGPFYKEPRIEAGLGLSSLKKASLFGTLEEAIQQTDDDSDSMISPQSGQSSPELPDISDKDFVSSTPLKITNVEVKTENEPKVETNVQIKTSINVNDQERPRPAQRTTHIEQKVETVEINTERNQSPQKEKELKVENDKVEVLENGHFIKDIIGDFTKEMNGEFSKGMNGGIWQENSTDVNSKTKQKDWDMSESALHDAYVTALNISVEDKPPDLPTSPPPNMNSFVTEIKVSNRVDDNNEGDDDEILDISDKDMTLLEQECDDSKIFKNGVYFTTDESLLMSGNMSPFSKSTLMSNSVESNRPSPPNKIENFINNINDKLTPDVNLSDEQILALKTSTNKITSNLYKTTNGESPSPNKRRIPSKSPSPSGKSPQRGNISITSIKTSGSRIPVRAFGNSSSSSSSDTSSTSPRSTSMIPDPKVRKSRKPEETEQNGRFSYSSTFTVSPISKSNVSSPEQRRYNGTSESSIILVDNHK